MAKIHWTAQIGPRVKIGENVTIGPFCIIGFPPELKGRENEDQGVIIGPGTVITGHVTIDSGADSPTCIGKDCYIMKGAHVGHDAMIGDDVTLSCHSIVGGHCIIEDGVNLGLGAIIHQRQRIAACCMIGMGAVVPKNLKTEPFKTYAGVPAKLLGDNTKHPKWGEYTINQKEWPL